MASVVAPHCASDRGWSMRGEAMREHTPDDWLEFFLAIEIDGRGVGHFREQLKQLRALDGVHWTYHLDKTAGADDYVSSDERFIRICTGRNLATAYALDTGATHVLFLDADALPPVDVVPMLLAVGEPVVFGHTPGYCLDGPRAAEFAGIDVRRHGDSLACVLVRRDVLRRVAFGWDPDEGLTDDPRFWRDVEHAGFGVPLTRHDCVVLHPPLVPLEQRGHDRRLRALRVG